MNCGDPLFHPLELRRNVGFNEIYQSPMEVQPRKRGLVITLWSRCEGLSNSSCSSLQGEFGSQAYKAQSSSGVQASDGLRHGLFTD